MYLRHSHTMTHYHCSNNFVGISQNGKTVLSLAILLVLAVLIVFYLVQVNKLVASNFELNHLQKSFKVSQDKDQALQVSLMQARSLDNLQRAAASLNLVTIEKTNYLKIMPSFFALSDQ